MSGTVPTQHPAVVLRSHYKHLRALLAVAMIAVIGLTVAVVVLATDEQRSPGAANAMPSGVASPAGAARYDGGPEEGTRGISAAQPSAMRPDGGPEEGTRGIGR